LSLQLANKNLQAAREECAALNEQLARKDEAKKWIEFELGKARADRDNLHEKIDFSINASAPLWRRKPFHHSRAVAPRAGWKYQEWEKRRL